MAAYFGVHVGNSSVCLSISKDDDRVEIVANDVGDRITPAILQWTPTSCTVGKTAQLELFRNLTNTIIRNKQLLNDNISNEELDNLKSQIPYKINKTDCNFTYELLIDGKQNHVTPREVIGWIFKKILATAESAVGEGKKINVVITVPLYFSSKSIQLVKDVAKKAGFNVLQVIDEPSAAALGCGLGLNTNESYYCLVYRVGGYSIDATILLIHDGLFSIIHSVHKSYLGGALFTEKLSQYLAEEFKRQFKTVDITERGKYKLFAAAETVKQVLSIQNVAQCSCESIGGGYDFNVSVSRARYENVIASLISDIVSPISEVLDGSGVKVDDIKKVVTCGGAMKTPKLQETLKKLLPNSEIIASNSDEIIALGAGRQAGYCEKFNLYPDCLSIDALATSTSLVIKADHNDQEFIVPEKTVVPIKKHFTISPTSDSITISLIDNSTILGTTTLNNLEPPVKILIDFDINKEGKILLTVINKNNNEKNYIKYDLNDNQTL